ncbi:hypothetical protein [Fulvimarina sp. MAC3]|uniref:hypothetical protein n=1 Tax=Fulvimarina sp. MAC3 TaxID=3148887 RepID=UPI0031FC0E57
MRDQETMDFCLEPDIEDKADPADADWLSADPVAAFSSVLTLWHLTPFVLAARVPKLVAETGTYSVFERDETRLAITEKIGAALEGAVAFQVQFSASMLALQAAVLEGKFAPGAYFEGFGELPSTALKPFVSRLQANADRLS